MSRARLIPRLLLAAFAISAAPLALAQTVSLTVNGNVATAQVNSLGNRLADVILTFDDASGLSASSLGLSAQLVSVTSTSLLSRLPSSVSIPSALPLLITIEPPANGGLEFARTVQVEIHTELLPYAAGTSLRLFKAPLNGPFVDITREVLPGSVRTRGTTGNFSQFLILADSRSAPGVAQEKFQRLWSILDALSPGTDKAWLSDTLTDAEDAVGDEGFVDAILLIDAFSARVAEQAGSTIADQWQPGNQPRNLAGELLGAAATLKFTLGVLRDYGN